LIIQFKKGCKNPARLEERTLHKFLMGMIKRRQRGHGQEINFFTVAYAGKMTARLKPAGALQQ